MDIRTHDLSGGVYMLFDRRKTETFMMVFFRSFFDTSSCTTGPRALYDEDWRKLSIP